MHVKKQGELFFFIYALVSIVYCSTLRGGDFAVRRQSDDVYLREQFPAILGKDMHETI